MADRIWRIKACLNGQRDPAAHPALPVTPAALAAQAAASVAAGAEAVHLHPRAVGGRESLVATDVAAAVAAVRAACPQTPVGVTTGLWTSSDARSRHEQVAAWAGLDTARRPDFASLNVSEPGWRELAGVLAEAGIRVEAGVWSVADAISVGDHQPPAEWLRIMIEISGVSAEAAPGLADEILFRLHSAAVSAPILLHGADESCWPLVSHAGRHGLPTRIGLEDVLTGPAGQPVTGNADLVRFALAEWAVAYGS
jgi:uncharacterized protein (DUF849 family)